MITFLNAVAILAGVVGGGIAILGVIGANGAPQQAAAAAVGMACAVIPYCVARIAQEGHRHNKETQEKAVPNAAAADDLWRHQVG